MLLHMNESFRSARELKGLVINASLERLSGALARTFIDPGQCVGVLLSLLPVFICPSGQFIELVCDGLFEIGGDADDTGDFAS
jgi:hypothetical protein